MNISHFRGVVFAKSTDEFPQYRYMVIGLLVTEKPIDEIQGTATYDGSGILMAQALEASRQRELEYPDPQRLGDAVEILTSLGEWEFKD